MTKPRWRKGQEDSLDPDGGNYQLPRLPRYGKKED